MDPSKTELCTRINRRIFHFAVDADLAPGLPNGAQVDSEKAVALLTADNDRRWTEVEAQLALNQAKKLTANITP